MSPKGEKEEEALISRHYYHYLGQPKHAAGLGLERNQYIGYFALEDSIYQAGARAGRRNYL